MMRILRNTAIGTVAVAIVAGAGAGAGAASSSTIAYLLPVDEAASRPSFFSFRAQLLAAVSRHDVAYVIGVLSPDVKASFGGDEGIEAFKRMWTLDRADSELWGELGLVLSLGGSFQAPDVFVAPYTFSRWPSGMDAFEHVAVTASEVRVRSAPSGDATVLTSVSFAILPTAPPGQSSPIEQWTAVRLDGGRIGFVASHLVRSPVDYRAIFGVEGGRWRLRTFVAGD